MGFNQIWNSLRIESLSEYKAGIERLLTSVKRIDKILDEEVHDGAVKCAIALIKVYHVNFMNLSKLYSDKRVSIVDEELLSTKTHDQYNITSKDLEETIERLMSLDSARAMRRDEDAEAEARIEINNIIDTL